MKVSIDGLRRNLARSYNDTATAFNDLSKTVETDDLDNIRDGLSDIRQYVAVLMCVYSDDKNAMFSDMSSETDELVEVSE